MTEQQGIDKSSTGAARQQLASQRGALILRGVWEVRWGRPLGEGRRTLSSRVRS
jgi:hypothetical protein